MAWTVIGLRPASAQAARNVAASSGLQFGGRHICGELAKIWIPSQPIVTALPGMPFSPPPDTWAPRRTRGVDGGGSVAAVEERSVGDMVIRRSRDGNEVRDRAAYERTFASGSPLYHADERE